MADAPAGRVPPGAALDELVQKVKTQAEKCRTFVPSQHIGPLWGVGYIDACRSMAGWLDDFAVELRAALDARPPQAPQEWHSIEMAPKEGAFLVYHHGAAGPRMMVHDGRMLALSRARDTPHHLSGHQWTHWQPLPHPPAADARRPGQEHSK